MKFAPPSRPLDAGLSPQRPGFLPRPLFWCVGFMVEKANLNKSFHQVLRSSVGRHTSVGIVTRYGWAVRGSNPDGDARFSAPVQTDPGAHPASYKCIRGPCSGDKAAVAWHWHRLPSEAVVKERIELYIYSPSMTARTATGWNPVFLYRCHSTIVPYSVVPRRR